MSTGVVTCTSGGTVVFRPDEAGPVDEYSQLVVDTPDGWTVTSSSNSLDYQTNSDSSSPETFTVPLTLTTQSRTPIDSNASTKVFSGDATEIGSAKAEQSEDYESKGSYSFVVSQSDCNLPSGEYVVHFRYAPSDTGRMTYLGSATIEYDAGTGGCTGSSASVK